MASKIVKSHLFPVGTAVGAYPLTAADVERREGRVPIPDPTATGVIGSDGTVEFTGLTAGVAYVMIGFVDEIQSVKIDATAGQVKLTFSGQQTGNVAFNATAAALREALEALSNVAPGDVEVTGGPGDSGGTKPYIVKFLATYAGTNVAAMTGANGTTPLSGGGAAITISTTTQGSKADEGGVQRTTVFTA
jgi:hypothetical protein